MLAAGAFGMVIAVGACHVFESVDECDSDADCPSGSSCDEVGRFCTLPPVVPSDDAADADRGVIDVVEEPIADDVADTSPPTTCRTLDPFLSFALVRGLEGTPILTARLTSDEQNLIYSALNGCPDQSCLDLFVAQRSSRTDPFGSGTPLAGVNCEGSAEYWSTISADGLLIFFESARSLHSCDNDQSRIWSSTRVNTSTEFGTPRNDPLFANDGGAIDSAPYLHPNGRSLYFVSLGRPGTGNQDIYLASIQPLGLVSTISELSVVNTTAAENFPVITRDDLTLYFARGDGPREVWAARRSTPTAAFDAPTRVDDFSGTDDVIPAWVSDDNCRFYFVSNRVSPDGGMVADYRLWVAERNPR